MSINSALASKLDEVYKNTDEKNVYDAGYSGKKNYRKSAIVFLTILRTCGCFYL